ncbi:hypothetical protein TRFO_03357 [Tritrichomonas foetus]|uniref:COMM domain-containing protein n=1 Tax=Tritrichomonas foetus TaxID=1144522 RepID=A0A1J4KQL7_9EUKA|nr:hypothetical protein TRFO_03357 [Tritrichomonas foetus]|eukprot:OHT13591.1 hypothetical protein TRFO_03357 [Tritrichomonas foetus]
MSTILEGLNEAQTKTLLLQVLSWRVGDMPSLVADLAKNFSISESNSIAVLELVCPILDYTINKNPESADAIFQNVVIAVNDGVKRNLAENAFASKEKCISFTRDHAPSLSRVLYHDYTLETQIATESLGRIARPVATITLRIQPSSKLDMLLPPLESVSMELAKDVIDALNSGFDRLQNQLSKIVQTS